MNKNFPEDKKDITIIKDIINNVRPEFDEKIPQAYRDLIAKCWSSDPLKRPTFEMIVNEIENNKEFITKDVDKDEFLQYIKFIKSANNPKNKKSNRNKKDSKSEPSKNKNDNDNDNSEDVLKDKDDDDKKEKCRHDDENEEEEDRNNYDDDEEKEEESIEEEEEEEEEEEPLIHEMEYPKINIRDYIKGERIGQGGYSNVFEAIKKKNKLIKRAAKIFKLQIDYDQEFKDNLIREVKFLSSLTHPYIIKFIGYSPINFEKKKYPLIMLEFFKNGSLNKFIEIKENIQNQDQQHDRKKYQLIEKLNEVKIYDIIYKIALVMKYLHSQNIIHRDLNLNNILLDDSLDPKLIDFGLSINESDNNNPCECIGTSPYMAPEIWENGFYSKASDVYAFAILVYELLTNKLVYRNTRGPAIMYKVLIEKERPKFPTKFPESYKKLIELCWNDDPTKRPSFDKILEILNILNR